jgi:hypothetical protein
LELIFPDWGKWKFLDEALLARVKEVAHTIDARLRNIIGDSDADIVLPADPDPCSETPPPE